MFINYEEYEKYPIFSEEDIRKHMMHLCFKGFVIGNKPGTFISIVEVHFLQMNQAMMSLLRPSVIK